MLKILQIVTGFENDGLQKNVIILYLDGNTSIHTKNGVAALSMMASIVLALLYKCGCPCHIKLDIRKFLQVLADRTKCSGGP